MRRFTASAPAGRRRKRAATDLTADTQTDFNFNANKSQVDAAVDAATGLTSVAAAKSTHSVFRRLVLVMIKLCLILAAWPCYRSNASLFVPFLPGHLENTEPDTTRYDTGTYIYFTCTRTNGGATYRHLDEGIVVQTSPPFDAKVMLNFVAAGDDNALDHKMGVLCNDGEFEPPTAWPDATKCIEVATCQSIPQPAADSLFKPVASTETPLGYSLFYGCKDEKAILDDGSGVNFFEVRCEGNSTHPVHGVKNASGVFIPGDPTYPKCLSQCKDFTVGNAQFK